MGFFRRLARGEEFNMDTAQALCVRAKRSFVLLWTLVVVVLALPATAQDQRTFNIPAQPLADALTAFGRQSGLQITYQPELVAGRISQAVSGSSTPAQALQQMLSGTGVTYRFTDAKTVTLERSLTQPGDPRFQLAPTQVEGQTVKDGKALKLEETQVTAEREREQGYVAKRASTGTRSDIPLIETPVSVQVIPREVIVDQAATRLLDLYQNVSGVQPSYTANNVSTLEAPIIRGFTVFNIYRDGFPVRGQAPTILSNVERVEILKGSGSVLYGLQEPGGILNIITKRPLTEPSHFIEQRFGSFDYYETRVDLGGPLTQNKELLYRLNVSYLNSGSFRRFVDNERWFIAPSLTWRLTPRTEINVDLSFSHEDFLMDNGVVFSPAGFQPSFRPILPISRFLQEPGFHSTRREWFVSYNVNHQVNDNWTLRHPA
jgi:iron complex outermembrane receptor protein